jgi:hypothetical protein
MQDGQGVEVWSDKSKYSGGYREGKKHGYGDYQWADGTVYKGEWWINNMQGYVSRLLIGRVFMARRSTVRRRMEEQ